MKKIAINGFGRIGRGFVRALRQSSGQAAQGLELVAINDLSSPESLAYLLKYDSVYGRFPSEVSTKEGAIVIDGKEIKLFAEKDPAQIPWKSVGVDIVIESTGFFTEAEKAQAHITAGAKRVVITAPGKGDGVDTILIGANDEKFASCGVITSNASCTTNAASPLIGILDEAIGIERAILNTTHAYTASQALVDGGKSKDMRESRAAAINMVPTSTGAAKATALAPRPPSASGTVIPRTPRRPSSAITSAGSAPASSAAGMRGSRERANSATAAASSRSSGPAVGSITPGPWPYSPLR